MLYKKSLQAFSVFFVLLLCGSSYSFALDEWGKFQKQNILYVNEFAHSAKHCIQQTDTSFPVFHGCIDWHSSVHGHWALLRAYRETQNKLFLQNVLSSLKMNGMEMELAYLKTNPSFEMPYGRAWFLKLMVEYEVVTGKRDFRYFSDYVAKTLLNYILAQPFDPSKREYESLSWAAVNLVQYYKHIGDSGKIELIKELIAPSLEKKISLNADRYSTDFFSQWGNWAYLLSNILSQKDFANWLDMQKITPTQLHPITEINSNHHLSMNYSRAWSFWSVYKMTGLLEYKDAYRTAIDSGLSVHSKYKNRYHAYGHWVPQFGIYAITISNYE